MFQDLDRRDDMRLLTVSQRHIQVEEEDDGFDETQDKWSDKGHLGYFSKGHLRSLEFTCGFIIGIAG